MIVTQLDSVKLVGDPSKSIKYTIRFGYELINYSKINEYFFFFDLSTTTKRINGKIEQDNQVINDLEESVYQ